MRMVHFTEGATDPLHGFCAHGVRFVPLADGAGNDETYVSCLHFQPGGWISDPPTLRDTGLFVVYGAITVVGQGPAIRIGVLAGVGAILDADRKYRIETDTGAIVLVVEAERLEATELGMSTPQRIWGQVWPGERVGPAPRPSVLSRVVSMYRWWRWRGGLGAPSRVRADVSGWVGRLE